MTNGAGIRVDPHVKLLGEDIVVRAKERGLDAVVYAPHFTPLPVIRETAARFSDDELVVIPAREVFTGPWWDRKHVLAMDLDEPVPDFVSLEAAFEAFARQDAVVLVPHPAFLSVSLERDDVVRLREVIHAVETYNPKHWTVHNRAAEAVARAADRPVFGSSYAHLPGTVGEVWTTFPDVEPTADAVVQAFRSGAPRTVDHRTGLGHRARRALEFGHLFYENSVAKFDRVVLSAREPTHPDQPLYAGQFSVDRKE